MSSVSKGTLHCFSGSPESEAAQRLLAQLESGDAVLLLGKAVVLAGTKHPESPRWLELGISLHALDEDLSAYAVTDPHSVVNSISYAGWVTLSETYPTQILWR